MAVGPYQLVLVKYQWRGIPDSNGDEPPSPSVAVAVAGHAEPSWYY